MCMTPLQMIEQAVEHWREEMEGDGEIGGADMVDWFCQWWAEAAFVLKYCRDNTA